MPKEPPIIVTGASGRLGRMLRLIWAEAPPAGSPALWLLRRPATAPDERSVDLLSPSVGLIDLPAGAIILHLAGTVAGPAADHAALAQAVLVLAERTRARHLFLASSAAVYGIGTQDHDEAEPPAPVSDYGRAKLSAEQVLAGHAGCTSLRIGNVARADAILGGPATARLLDPVPDGPSGPVRSYIGPRVLAGALASLVRLAAAGRALPAVLNLAQDPPLAMGDLLTAAGLPWSWGPPNPRAIPRVALSTRRLDALVPGLPRASAAGMVMESRSIPGWPA